MGFGDTGVDGMQQPLDEERDGIGRGLRRIEFRCGTDENGQPAQ